MQHTVVSRNWVKLSLALFSMVALLSTAKAQLVFDSSKDFSATANPTGPWSYGWYSTASGFQLYPDCVVLNGLKAWLLSEESGATGNVVCNTSDSVQTSDGIPFEPGDMSFHPGDQGNNGVIRWTAPFTGLIKISALFKRADQGSTIIHVRLNRRILFEKTLPARTETVSFKKTIRVSGGDVLDFEVDANGYVGDDTVRVHVNINGVQTTPSAFVGYYTGSLFMSENGRRWQLGDFVLQIDPNLKVIGRLLLNGQVYDGTGYAALDGTVALSFSLPYSPLPVRINLVREGRNQLNGTGDFLGAPIVLTGRRVQ